MRKLTVLFAGAMMLAGAAHAEDGVLIGDKALDGMTAGTGCITACVDIYKSMYNNVWSSVNHYTNVHGFSAESIGDAIALGYGALTVTTNRTYTDPFKGVSQSSGYAASYSNPAFFAPCCK